MTNRAALLKQAHEFEAAKNKENARRASISKIRNLLSDNEMRVVDEEAKVRTVLYLESGPKDWRTGHRYSLHKGRFVDEVIGEWYIDQQKPVESRAVEQAEV